VLSFIVSRPGVTLLIWPCAGSTRVKTVARKLSLNRSDWNDLHVASQPTRLEYSSALPISRARPYRPELEQYPDSQSAPGAHPASRSPSTDPEAAMEDEEAGITAPLLQKEDDATTRWPASFTCGTTSHLASLQP
jgi:hypothetical protein